MNWGYIFGARLMALSEVKIRKAKPLAKAYKLADEKGLIIIEHHRTQEARIVNINHIYPEFQSILIGTFLHLNV